MILWPAQVELVTVSPSDHWIRSIIMISFGAYFAVLSLKFLKNVTTGVTLVYSPSNPFLSLNIVKGKIKSVPKGHKASYNGPLSTALLGLLLFAAAQTLIVMMFKRAEYMF
jgi:hypothetical protein